ncbi:MAG TPA: nucleotidyl transferase AbiEii/AbiGii toxin family protein [Burkholderiaceae bacterium]|nr:nucleotidyl transferase AbiEii/AbiGii toxin family protein [Burkholderiaceae bacterium]
MLYTPSERGFDAGLEAIDRCQVGLLRELSGQLGNRLTLKGGMAMRVAFGSMRLTKDIDFDRDQTISQDALKKNLERMLVRAASTAGIRSPKVQITKDTKTTVRARLEGTIGGKTDARFDVEVSGRDTPARENVRSEIVTPPAKYAMAPFPVTTYTNAALAAMKIGAALSAQRNAPRDLYDLRELIWARADPTELLSRQDADLLKDFSDRALGKLELLTFQLAQQELLPYLPPDDRRALNEAQWIETTLMVADTIQGWCKAALELQQEPQGPKRPQNPERER